MKKIICSLLLVSSLVWVSAQEQQEAQTQARKRDVGQAQEQKIGTSTPVSGDVSITPKERDGGVDMTGITGHAETDNKVAALRASYRVKFKALQEQFKADLKALIKDRKLMHDKRVDDMRGGSWDKIRIENASGTKPATEIDIKDLRIGKDGKLRVKDNRSFFQRLFGIGN